MTTDVDNQVNKVYAYSDTADAWVSAPDFTVYRRWVGMAKFDTYLYGVRQPHLLRSAVYTFRRSGKYAAASGPAWLATERPRAAPPPDLSGRRTNREGCSDLPDLGSYTCLLYTSPSPRD